MVLLFNIAPDDGVEDDSFQIVEEATTGPEIKDLIASIATSTELQDVKREMAQQKGKCIAAYTTSAWTVRNGLLSGELKKRRKQIEAAYHSTLGRLHGEVDELLQTGFYATKF